MVCVTERSVCKARTDAKCAACARTHTHTRMAHVSAGTNRQDAQIRRSAVRTTDRWQWTLLRCKTLAWVGWGGQLADRHLCTYG
jgi:hypothetical protein